MADEALGAPLLDRDALVRSLRGESPPEDGKREEDACDARVEPHTPAVDGVDAYFRLSAAASAAKTDLASAAPAFARLLDALSSRVLGAMLLPLWLAALVGPSGAGPAGLAALGDARWVHRWLGLVSAGLAGLATPLQLYVAGLAVAWPSSYDACLRCVAARRRRPPADEPRPRRVEPLRVGDAESADEAASADGGGDDGDAPSLAAPPGARVLRCAAAVAPVVACAGFLAQVALYARDAVDLRCDETPGSGAAAYPWACAWASASSLATRLALAAGPPLALAPPALFAAHALALAAALRAAGPAAGGELVDDSRLDEGRQLVDDANGLWRWPAAAALAASAALGALGARRAAAGGGRGEAAAALCAAFLLAAPVAGLAANANAAVDAAGFDGAKDGPPGAEPAPRRRRPSFLHAALRPRRLAAFAVALGAAAALAAALA